MKRSVSLLSLLLFWVLSVLGQYIPPDFYGETYNKTAGFWSNQGQVVDTDQQLREDVHFYSESGLPRIFMRQEPHQFFTQSQHALG